MQSRVSHYFDVLGKLPMATQVTDTEGKSVSLPQAFDGLIARMRATHDAGGKIMFIGNGGSAAIASHMATDYCKNGGLRSVSFNDGSTLTCLGNDLGYENVFAAQINMHARAGDMLIAISSSGKSANILKAADAARERGCFVATLSGFSADNPLRTFGDVNFYVDSAEYGFVEITHLALCHSWLDLAMGWGAKENSALDAHTLAA